MSTPIEAVVNNYTEVFCSYHSSQVLAGAVVRRVHACVAKRDCIRLNYTLIMYFTALLLIIR